MKKSLSIFLLLTILLGASLLSTISAVPSPKTPVIVGFKDLPDAALIHAHGGEIKYEYSLIHAIAVSLPPQAIEALRNNPKVAYVEDDVEVKAAEYNSGGMEDWGVIKIGAKVVHQTDPPNMGTNIKVAVIDTGINYGHIDLTDNALDALGNKLGYNFLSQGTTPPIDDNGHGTHCAGIIAAELNNAAVVGVAPEAKIYALKVLNSAGSGYTSDIIAAIQWACSNGIQVISMSLGSSVGSTPLQEACDDAFLNYNIVVVAAAGNNGAARTGSNILYPARYANVIAVGATDSNNVRASFSNTGPELDLMAPGVNILSDYLNQDTLKMSGTSMATPHVAGTAALVLCSNEAAWQAYGLTNGDGIWASAEVSKVLISTADDLGTTGKDNLYGYGLVDADQAALTPTPPPVVKEKIYSSTTTTITKGTIDSGNVDSLSANDNTDMVVKSAKVGSSQTIDWFSNTKIDVVSSKVQSLTITYDGSFSKSQSQTLYLYNFASNTWQSIKTQTVGTSDSTITYTTNTPTNFISAQGDIQLRTYATQRTSTSFTCNADYTQISLKYTE